MVHKIVAILFKPKFVRHDVPLWPNQQQIEKQNKIIKDGELPLWQVGIVTTHYSVHTNNILDSQQSMRHSNDMSHAIENYIPVTWYVTVQSPHKTAIFLQNTMGIPQLAHEGNIWFIYCELKVWSSFYVTITMLLRPNCNKHWFIFQ